MTARVKWRYSVIPTVCYLYEQNCQGSKPKAIWQKWASLSDRQFKCSLSSEDNKQLQHTTGSLNISCLQHKIKISVTVVPTVSFVHTFFAPVFDLFPALKQMDNCFSFVFIVCGFLWSLMQYLIWWDVGIYFNSSGSDFSCYCLGFYISYILSFSFLKHILSFLNVQIFNTHIIVNATSDCCHRNWVVWQ